MIKRIRIYKPRVPTSSWIDRVCIICTKNFKVMPWRIKKGGALYCSIGCLPQNQKGSNVGRCQVKDKNSNWKGGITHNHYIYKLRDKERHPEKHKARELVMAAKRSGKLIVKPCCVCGSIEKIHAHHEDYSKPLDVKWLCAACHRAEHR